MLKYVPEGMSRLVQGRSRLLLSFAVVVNADTSPALQREQRSSSSRSLTSSHHKTLRLNSKRQVISPKVPCRQLVYYMQYPGQ